MNSLSTLGRMLLKRVELSKNKSALGWINNDKINFYTFKDYLNVIESISLVLIKYGLKEGDRVAILGNTCKEWHLLDISSLCSKAIVVPVYHTYLAHEIEYIYNHAECSVLCIEDDAQLEKIISVFDQLNSVKLIVTFNEVSSELKKKIPADVKIISFKGILLEGEEEVKQNPDTFINNIQTQSSEQIASIIYTSGTTGEPKGAVIKQKAFTKMLHNVNDFIKGGFSESDRSLTFLPLSHVIGRCDSYLPLIFGCEMVFAESIEKIIHNISLVKPTYMLAVPRIFEKIYARIIEQVKEENLITRSIFKWANMVSNKYYSKIERDLSPTANEYVQFKLAYKIVFEKIYNKFGGRIRFFVSGGAPLSSDIIKFLRNANLTILEGYGLTETIAPCVLNPISRQIPGTVGKPIGDVELKFAEDGEILIKSKALFSEYYKNSEETKKVMVDGWFYSGDIGKFDENGFLVITDRKKDIIITSGGKNVAPQKIENMLKLKSHISNAVIIGDKRKYLTALISVEKDSFINDLKDLGLTSDIDFENLVSNPKIRAIIREEIEEVNADLASFEAIKKFFIIPVVVDQNNYLTPSLKVKKKQIIKDYKKEIDALYQ